MTDLTQEHTCPECGSTESTALGTLGFLFWLRCRDCGMDYSIRIELLDREV